MNRLIDREGLAINCKSLVITKSLLSAEGSIDFFDLGLPSHILWLKRPTCDIQIYLLLGLEERPAINPTEPFKQL